MLHFCSHIRLSSWFCVWFVFGMLSCLLWFYRVLMSFLSLWTSLTSDVSHQHSIHACRTIAVSLGVFFLHICRCYLKLLTCICIALLLYLYLLYSWISRSRTATCKVLMWPISVDFVLDIRSILLLYHPKQQPTLQLQLHVTLCNNHGSVVYHYLCKAETLPGTV